MARSWVGARYTSGGYSNGSPPIPWHGSSPTWRYPFGWYFYLNWHTEIGPALVYAFALAMLSHGPRSRFLAWTPVAALGRRSYALYLLHPFALFLTALAFERAGLVAEPLASLPFRVVGLLLTLCFAEAAHRFVEVPTLRTKDRLGAMVDGLANALSPRPIERSPDELTLPELRHPPS